MAIDISPSIERVPPEVFALICSTLERVDLQNLSRTGRRMHERMRYELAKRNLHVHIIGKTLSQWKSRFLQKPSIFTRGLQDLTFHIDVSPKGLRNAFKHTSTDDDSIDALSRCKSPDEIFPLPSSLHTLHLIQGQTYTPSPLAYHVLSRIPTYCPHLHHLTLSNIHREMLEGMHQAISCLPHLRSLVVRTLKPVVIRTYRLLPMDGIIEGEAAEKDELLLDALSRSISALPHLSSLSLELNSQGLLDMVLHTLADAHTISLTHLSITEGCVKALYRRLTPEAISSISEALCRLSGRLPPLREFHLSMIHVWQSAIHLPLLHQACQGSLRNISFTQLPRITFPPRVTWPRLESLNIVCCLGLEIGDDALFPRLTSLACQGLGSITGSGHPFPVLSELSIRDRPLQVSLAAMLQHPLSLLHLGTWESSCIRRTFLSFQHISLRCVRLSARPYMSEPWENFIQRLLVEFPNVESLIE